jgi:putative endonuclease
MNKTPHKNPWSVYIVECRDKTLYTGVAKDVAKRVQTHNTGIVCRYTRARKPVILKYTEVRPTYSAALKRESQIKKFDRQEKLALIG